MRPSDRNSVEITAAKSSIFNTGQWSFEDSALVRCYNLSTGKELPTFRSVLPPSSGSSIPLKKEATLSSETSVTIYRPTRINISQDLSLYIVTLNTSQQRRSDCLVHSSILLYEFVASSKEKLSLYRRGKALTATWLWNFQNFYAVSTWKLQGC